MFYRNQEFEFQKYKYDKLKSFFNIISKLIIDITRLIKLLILFLIFFKKTKAKKKRFLS